MSEKCPWPTVIAVDFDGTLCESAWPGIGKPRQPVIRELIRRQRMGARIVLWTCRTGKLLDEAILWCLDRGIVFDAINGNVPERVRQYGDDPRKVSADEYWDDKAIPVHMGIGLCRMIRGIAALPRRRRSAFSTAEQRKGPAWRRVGIAAHREGNE